MTLRHVVMWKMATVEATDRAAHAAEAASRLAALEGRVPQIRAITVGTNVVEDEGNWDLVLVVDVDGPEELEAYQVHPAHKEVVEFVRSVVAARAAVDIQISDAKGS